MAPKLAPQMESFFSDAMGTIMGGVAPRCIAMALHGLSLKIFYMCHGSLSPNRLLSPYLRLQRETSGTEWHSSNTIYFWATALRGDLPLPPRPHDAASLPAQTVVDWFGKLRGQRVTPNPTDKKLRELVHYRRPKLKSKLSRRVLALHRMLETVLAVVSSLHPNTAKATAKIAQGNRQQSTMIVIVGVPECPPQPPHVPGLLLEHCDELS